MEKQYVTWVDADVCYAGRTVSRNYVTREDLPIEELSQLWSGVELE